jgi:predicted TIM-barrel enzyme
MLDANQLVFDTARREVPPQVEEVPLVAGVNGVDVLRDMEVFLEDCRRICFAGVHNSPTVGWFDGECGKTLEENGLGYQKEIDMLNSAREP